MLGDSSLLLGDDLLPWLLFAIGSALIAANIAALIRPPLVDPRHPEKGRRDRPPLGRVVPLVLLGLIVGGWALASLLK
jgi:hypothetical protein